MALTLLDYLFDRETQACSNLSGMGKHGKKQLDPLMIYGIWCKFNFFIFNCFSSFGKVTFSYIYIIDEKRKLKISYELLCIL